MKVTRIGCSENLVPSPGRVLMYWSAPVGFFAPTRETIEAKARYPEIFEGRTTAPSCSEDFSQKSIRGINSELYAANIPVVPIAIWYRTTSKSEFGEIQGVGSSGKRALLDHFGVARGVKMAGLTSLETDVEIKSEIACLVYTDFDPGVRIGSAS